MKIIHKTGSLLDADEPVIIHGCNAQGKMNSGVAKLIRAKWPGAYQKYFDVHNYQGLKTGMVVWWSQPGDKFIGNAITQHNYGRNPNTVYVEYAAMREAMKNINSRAPMWIGEGGCVAMPLIGAGLANGHWPTIAAIIEQEATNFQPVVYTLDGVVPA